MRGHGLILGMIWALFYSIKPKSKATLDMVCLLDWQHSFWSWSFISVETSISFLLQGLCFISHSGSSLLLNLLPVSMVAAAYLPRDRGRDEGG